LTLVRLASICRFDVIFRDPALSAVQMSLRSAGLSIQRYRLLRPKLLETYRQKAIEAALGRIDLAGIVPDCQDEAEYYTRQNALSWRIDPMATTEIDARLAAYGFDAHVINTEVHVQAHISSSCSRACSTPHKQNACSSSEKFGTNVSQVDQWVRVVETRLRSLAQPQSDKVVLCARHDMHHAGFARECAVVICRKSKRVEGSAGQCAVAPNRVPFSQN
jgi:hypothetical protein